MVLPSRRALAPLAVVVALAAGCATAPAGSESTDAPRRHPAPSTTAEDQGRPSPGPAIPAGDDTTVESVTDGDTIRVAGGTRVRLIGIDTPEVADPRTGVECFGPEASARMRELLAPGTPVRLVYDVERLDRYERTLAYVYRLPAGEFVNASMVGDGYASAYTVPPNVAHADEFVALQREAREANRGLWGGCERESAAPASGCDASYPDVCIPPAPPDLDCGDIAPRRFRVVGADPHRFDGEGDGLGCESG